MAGFPAMSDNVSRNKHINFYRHIKINLSYFQIILYSLSFLMTAPCYCTSFTASNSKQKLHICFVLHLPKEGGVIVKTWSNSQFTIGQKLSEQVLTITNEFNF